MRKCGILSVFHYQSLHNSPFYKIKHGARELKNADKFSDQLIRLPLYYELTEKELEYIVNSIKEFYL